MIPVRRRLSALVNRPGLDELEEGDFGLEPRSIMPLHLEASGHRAEGRWERAAGCVFEGLAGFEHWLFSNYPGTVYFLGVAGAVDDRPMAVEQLNGRISHIRNADRIKEKPPTRGRVAVLRREMGANLNADAGGFSFGRRFEKITFGHRPNSSRQVIEAGPRRSR